MEQLTEKNNEIVPEYWKNLSLENIIYFNDDGIECVEEWRDIKGYEGLYMVSDLGRVKGIKRVSSPNKKGSIRELPEAIKPSFSSRKYRRVELSKNGVNQKFSVHQLVGISFIQNTENKPQVNHLFGIKWDNRKWMLEWATKSEDRQHAIKVLGAGTGNPWKNCKKEDHPMYGRKGKLAPSSKPIICNENGVEYASIREASQKLKIPETTLKYVLMGLTKKSKIPYTFKYI